MATKKLQILDSVIKTDDTLTQSGIAADAKATGDAVAQKTQVQIITTDVSEILPTLKIHKLTQEQYDQELANGNIDENALYLTPVKQQPPVQIITWEAND